LIFDHPNTESVGQTMNNGSTKRRSQKWYFFSILSVADNLSLS